MRFGARQATDNTTPETPIPLHEAGTVFLGRGMEQHGVPMAGTPDLTDQTPETEEVLVEAPEPEPDPVPVRIVRSGGRELVRMRTQRGSCTDVIPTQIVGRDETRNVTRIRNLSSTAGDRLWIAEAQHLVQTGFGYPLDPGAELVLNHENEVYAARDSSAPTNPLPYAVLVEYVVAID